MPLEPFQHFLTIPPAAPSVLLESARVSPLTGRYSICGQDPFLIFSAKGHEIQIQTRRSTRTIRGNPFETLKALLKKYRRSGAGTSGSRRPLRDGGAIGYLAYECKNYFEPTLTRKALDDLHLPDLYFLFFDRVSVWDHLDSKGRQKNHLSRSPMPRRDAQHFRGQDSTFVHSSLTRKQFEQRVRQAKAFIRRGDIFQANLSQRLSFSTARSAREIYQDLRQINPSSFFGILQGGDFQIICGSPERLVCVRDGWAQTRPIAGTRPRGATQKKDRQASVDLMLSPKERAEHLMLVDLERNDLGRVCEYGSVKVNEFMVMEEYSHVKHIVSNVVGKLKPRLEEAEVLAALFPGGTITGAPKVRCMQIIDELEPVARGPYTGSMGYFDFTGGMDFNIIIRSLVLKGRQATLSVGAGIVADSIPGKEYEETLHKAKAILVAVLGQRATRAFFRRCGMRA